MLSLAAMVVLVCVCVCLPVHLLAFPLAIAINSSRWPAPAPFLPAHRRARTCTSWGCPRARARPQTGSGEEPGRAPPAQPDTMGAAELDTVGAL